MLPDPYLGILDVSGSETSEPFSLLSPGPSSSVRKNLTAADGDPKVLKISHSVVGKGESARDRHLVRLESYVVEDSLENVAKPIAFYAVFDVPKVGVTTGQITSMFQQFVGLIRGAGGDASNEGDQAEFLDRILAGES